MGRGEVAIAPVGPRRGEGNSPGYGLSVPSLRAGDPGLARLQGPAYPAFEVEHSRTLERSNERSNERSTTKRALMLPHVLSMIGVGPPGLDRDIVVVDVARVVRVEILAAMLQHPATDPLGPTGLGEMTQP